MFVLAWCAWLLNCLKGSMVCCGLQIRPDDAVYLQLSGIRLIAGKRSPNSFNRQIVCCCNQEYREAQPKDRNNSVRKPDFF